MSPDIRQNANADGNASVTQVGGNLDQRRMYITVSSAAATALLAIGIVLALWQPWNPQDGRSPAAGGTTSPAVTYDWQGSNAEDDAPREDPDETESEVTAPDPTTEEPTPTTWPSPPSPSAPASTRTTTARASSTKYRRSPSTAPRASPSHGSPR